MTSSAPAARTMAAVASVVVVAALAAGCTAPSYGDGHLQCGPADACPRGFFCASDRHCWRDGSGPPVAIDDLGATVDLATLSDLARPDLGGGPSRCGVAGALLCDGFETSLLLNGWAQSTTNGAIAIDSTRVFRGSSSLHAHVDASPVNKAPRAVIHERKTFPISPVLYLRVWAYFPSPLPASYDQSFNFTDAGTTGIAIASDGGAVTLDDYAGNLYQSSATQWPLDRWTCLQFDMTQGTSVGALHVYVDGQLLGDLPQTGTTPTIVDFALGLDFNANTASIPPYDAWFDEVIVDDKPTRCDE